jgi:hypothetical protein
MTRRAMISAVPAFIVAVMIVVFAVAVMTAQTVMAPGTTTSGTTFLGGKSVSIASLHGLELQVSLNATEIASGETVQVSLSEFNTLPTLNNVSAAEDWVTQVALGACRNIYAQPFGIAVYYGQVDAQSLAQGRQVPIFPFVACPMYIRLVTGYEFQPGSDLALVLPSSGAVPSPLTGSIGIGFVYSGPQSQPLPSGSYTVVAGDEWGALAFIYFQVK